MTCEVVCLNRYGASICADSAVSVGANGKAYTGTEKIIPLGGQLPVAVTVFGRADFVGVPWGLILEEFSHSLGGQEAPHLETYLSRLVAFLESDHPLVSGEAESDEYVRWAIAQARTFLQLVPSPQGRPDTWGDEAWTDLRAALTSDEARAHATSPRLGPEFGEKVISANRQYQERVLTALFGAATPPADVVDSLTRMLARRAATATEGSGSTGLVFVGYGQSEFFPWLIELRAEAKLAGRLRYSLGANHAISTRKRSCIATFAQSEMVEAFLHGMTIDAWAEAHHIFREVLAEFFGDELSDYSRNVIAEEIARRLIVFTNEEYTEPLEEAASVLPVDELAELARTLVSLAAFRSRLSVVETGSVGGELRVCTISKRHGFKWKGQPRS